MPSTRRLEATLKAYWKLDSTYGTSVSTDSVGTNTLNQGAVASGTGKVNEAASFTRASSQYLGIDSNSNLQSLKTVAFWIKFTTISNDMTIFHKGSDATAANSSIWIKYDTGNNRIQFQVGNGAGASATASTSGFTFATGTWYFVCCRADTAIQQLSISVNGTLYGTGSFTITQLVETGVFYLGRSSSGTYLDGLLDEVAVSQSSLTIAEELVMYNGGTGSSTPFLEGPIGVDASSNRYPRRLPPSFAQANNGNLYIAYGDEGVRKWDGLSTTYPFAGVPAPTATPVLAGSGEGRIIGDRYAYLRYLDTDGRVSNLSPISARVFVHGTQKAITNATNAAPIVITSASHGLSTGEQIYIEGIQGVKSANGLWNVVKIDANTFSLVGSAGDSEYTGSDSGSVQVTTLQNGAAGVNEVQTITGSAIPTGGTWTITHDGATTSALQYNANAAAVQTALELLTTIGSGNVTVSGGALGTAAFTVTFIGTEGSVAQPAMTVTSSLTGSTITLSVAVLTEGNAGTDEVQTFALYGTPTGGTFTLTYDGQTTAAIAYNAVNATVDTELEALSNIGAGDITIGGGPLPGTAVTVTFGNAMAATNVPEMTINGASLTGGAISITMSTPTAGGPNVVANLRHYYTLNETSGFRYDSVGVIYVGAPADLGGAGDAVTAIAGKQSNAAYFPFVSSLQTLNSGQMYQTLGDLASTFSMCGWIRIDSLPSVAISVMIMNRGVALDGSVTLHQIMITSAGVIYAGIYRTSGGWVTSPITATTATTMSLATWYFVAYRWNASTKTGTISVNGGTNYTVTATETTASDTAGVCTFYLNSNAGRYAGTAYDEVAIWTRELSAADITYMYNGGTGRTYPLPSGDNEVQRITIAGTPTQGTFTLTYAGQTTAPIAYNATAANVVTALEALSNIGTGNVTGANGPLPGTAVNITFTGTLAATDVAAMTADANKLTTSITTTTGGSAATNEIQRISTSPTPTSGTFTLTYGGNTTSAIAYNATAATIDAALEALASIGAGQVACTGGPINTTPVLVTFTGTLANTNVATITAASSLTGPAATITVATTTEGVGIQNEKQQIYTQGTIAGGTFDLTLDSAIASGIAYDATASTVQTAIQGMSSVGSGNATTTGGPLPATPITIEFVSSKASTNMAEMTVNNGGIVAGGWSRGAALITYTNLQAPTDRRVTKRQVLRNKFGDATVFYIDLDTTDLTSTSLSSANTDEMLGAAVALQDSNGNDLNVVRHGEPPNTKRAIASFLNRLFLAVNHRNVLGELTVTASSTTITGEDAFIRTVFDNRTVYPQGTSNTKAYVIDSLSVPNQTVTTTVAYNGTTANGVTYGIEQAEPDDLVLYYSEIDDPEWWNALSGLTIAREEQDGEMTGLLPLATSMLIMFENRSFKLTFRASPLLSSAPETGGDGRIVPASARGCVNHRCAVKYGGKAYLMDMNGIYSFDDSSVEELSDPIATVFVPGSAYSIYWEARDSFHAVSDTENDTIKWFVVLGDGVYPRHALCYHVERQRFWIEEYPFAVASSCVGRVGGRQVVFYGSTARRLFVATENLDAISVQTNNLATLRGTATSSNAWSLTDSGASFPSSMTNVPVALVSGTGAGQMNVIVSNTATKLTVLNPWNIAPDTTTVYQIGGIKWVWKSSMMRLDQKNSEEMRGVQMTFTPTTRASTVVMRTYPDFSATADSFSADYSSDGVTTKNGSNQIVLDMTQSRGFVEVSSDSFFAGRGGHQRYVTVELTGTTNGDRQKVGQIDVLGADA